MADLDAKFIYANFKTFLNLFALGGMLLWFGQSPAFAANVAATWLQTIYTKSPETPSFLSKPSPDPSGIAYLNSKDTLLDCDGEVDEMPALFTGDNLFEISRSGVLLNTYSTTTLSRNGYSNEPVGCAFDPVSGHLFISDDDQRRVFELSPDNNGNFTLNSPRTSFSAPSVCNIADIDAEGVAYGEGAIFIIDGVGAEVWKVQPGNDGVFGSANGTATGETCTHFDTSDQVLDPEGGEYDPDTPGHLYVVGKPANQVIDYTTSGTWVRTIDIGISSSLPKKPAGLAAVPKNMTTDGKTHLFVVDRGIDNDNDPNENDGKIYEFSLPNSSTGNQPPTVSAGSDQLINISADAVLNGTVTDEGAYTVAWTQVSGPGTVSFADANAVDTTASFSASGTYVLRLTATDTQPLSSSDDVQITVQPDLPFAKIYISTVDSGTALNSNPSACGGVGSVTYADEDILAYDLQSHCWSIYFDGSDVSLGGSGVDVDAFYLLADGSILLSLTSDGVTLPNGVGAIDDSDIVRFIPTSIGTTTAGSYEWYFDGSDVELSVSAEDIDAISFTPTGQLVVSTIDSPTVTGISSPLDEDLLVFNATSLGANTSGTWSLYFDGSDVELSQSSSEDVNGAWIDGNGDIYLTTLGAFSVTGASGAGDDIFRCIPASTGSTTACTYDFIWDGIGNGLPAGAVVDGMSLARAASGSDTTSPSVGITAPVTGATVSGTTTAVSADASDNIGVAGVQFKLDGANLGGEDTTAPYSISWDTTTVQDGEHTLTALARDAAGNQTLSDPITVTVNNSTPPGGDAIPPTVNITAPLAGTTVSGTAVAVSADASDNIGVAGVQFRLDDVNLGGEDTTAPYSISWNTTTASNSLHALTAVARDAAGNQTLSDPITVTVNNSTPPADANLTHQWKFDETSGTSALDSVGTNNALLSNASWVIGKIGNAASFNGNNASGDAGKIDFGTGNFTVAHWVKVNGFKTYPAIFNNRSSASGNIGFHTRTDGTSTITALIDFGATSKNLAVTNLVIGTWYHIAVSVDRAGLMKLYVNGALRGQVDISGFQATSITNTDNVRIGRDQSSNYFNGVIDDLRLYNTALSATEISNLYTQ